uniref:Putative LAGLIDADG homing endonuclease n=1 Tax=Coleochaete scutata TaxID=3125 RepID=A0A5P9NWK4_COLSC|nr:putative LAGLIDADG homing endonuclease [Coleochaete scutata]QFU80103.1 putative LAGLIDADG homing endonuclease [Coleochaete scutata]
MNLSFSGSRRKTEKEELLKICGSRYNLELHDLTTFTEHAGKIMIQAPSTETLNPYYLSGLVDGDSSFSVRFRKNRSIKPAFTLGLEGDNQQLLLQVKKYFACGKIYQIKPTFWRYQVSDLHSLQTKIIPHFKLYPLHTFKRNHFWLFARVCDLMSQSQHRNREGFLKFIEIAYEMNEHGKRRRVASKMEYINLISKHELKV